MRQTKLNGEEKRSWHEQRSRLTINSCRCGETEAERKSVSSIECFWDAAETARHFRYYGFRGSFSARYESRAGGDYWYAYRKQGGVQVCCYIGPTSALTREQLERTARALMVKVEAKHQAMHLNIQDQPEGIDTAQSEPSLPISTPKQQDATVGTMLAPLQQAINRMALQLAQQHGTHPLAITLSEEEQKLLVLLAQTASYAELARMHGGYDARHIQRKIEQLCQKCDVPHHHQLVVWGTLHGYCQLSVVVEETA